MLASRNAQTSDFNDDDWQLLPVEFFSCQSVVIEFTYTNLVPLRSWGSDKLRISLSDGLVNFISGAPGSFESGYQGSAPQYEDAAAEQLLKHEVAAGKVVFVEDVLPIEIEMHFRWCNHESDPRLLSQFVDDPREFVWIARTWKRVSGCTYLSHFYRYWSFADRVWSDERPGLAEMVADKILLANIRTSPTQGSYCGPWYEVQC